MSRKIVDLIPEMQELARDFAVKMAEEGHAFMFTSTYRSQEEQNAIYAQGRTTPGKIVTWTRNSRHTQRDAFDIALLLQGKPIWDPKIDIDADHIPDYLEAGKIGESVGLVWGGRFKNSKGQPRPDYCHFELKKKA